MQYDSRKPMFGKDNFKSLKEYEDECKRLGAEPYAHGYYDPSENNDSRRVDLDKTRCHEAIIVTEEGYLVELYNPNGEDTLL